MIVKTILIILAVIAFVLWFIKKAKRVRKTKRRVRIAHAKWLLEKADDCDLKAEDDDSTKTLPIIEEP